MNAHDERAERRVSQSELADIVAAEWSRPMLVAEQKDHDAFTFFAAQDEVSLLSSRLRLCFICGFTISLMLFVVAFVLVFTPLIYLALGCLLTGYLVDLVMLIAVGIHYRSWICA